MIIKHNTAQIGGSVIQHCTEITDSDLQLVFDYLFHKQCLKIWEAGGGICRRADYTIYPLAADDPGSLWQFESVRDMVSVQIERTFNLGEMRNIATKALTVALALRMLSADMLPASAGLYNI
ncbi:MAG: hypothetical protein AB7F25_11190 [Deferribacterales bacterium]